MTSAETKMLVGLYGWRATSKKYEMHTLPTFYIYTHVDFASILDLTL